MPLDVGRVTHLQDKMHRAESSNGTAIASNWIVSTDGTKAVTWRPESAASVSYGSNTSDVSVTASAGVSSLVTRADHVHRGVAVNLGGRELVKAHGNSGSTETIDLIDGNVHTVTLNADCTFTFTGATNGYACSFTLKLTQDGTGSRLATWPGSVVWPGGSAPTLSTTAGALDVIVFESDDGGTTWLGFPTGGSGSALTVKDEGSSLDTAVTSLDFVGAGVVATNTSHAVTVTVSGAPTGTAGGDLSGTYPNPSVVDDSHSHTSATVSGGHILLADGHATPFTFNDLLQMDDGSDFLYSD